jgi:hypothetical protein
MIENLSALSWWKKVLLLVGLPLILLLLVFGAWDTVQSLINSLARKGTDDKSAELDEKIKATQSEIDKSSGRLEQLEKDKKDAIDATKDDDPTSFYNNRYKPDDE